MELTHDQAEAIRNCPNEMLELIDPTTNQCYVVLAKDAFDRIRTEADDSRLFEGWLKATQLGMVNSIK
jgi:hypothetical protein